MSKISAIAIAVAAVLIVAGFTVVRSFAADNAPIPQEGQAAPTFTLPTLNSPSTSLSPHDLRGQVWVLNVWASWCEACRDEHPHLVEFAKLKALPIYGLDYKDQREPAQQWLAERGNPYDASLFDGNGRVGIDFGDYGVPETFIIDKQGVIRFKQIGALTPEVLADKVLPLLRKLNG